MPRFAALRAVHAQAVLVVRRMHARNEGHLVGHWAFLAFDSGYLLEWGDGCENYGEFQDRVKEVNRAL